MQLNDEKVYKKIFELLPDLILITNHKGEIVYGNNQIITWLGYDLDEIVGHNVLKLKFITTRSKLLMGKNFIRRFAGQKIEPYIIDFRAKNGEMKSGLVRGKMIKNDQGKTVLNVSLVTNVTKETNEKRNLQFTEQKYKYLFDNMVDGFTVNELIYDGKNNPIDYKFLEINNSFEETLGLEAKKLVDQSMKSKIPSGLKEVFDHVDKFCNVVKSKEPISFEVYSKKLDKWFRITSHCPADDQFVVFYQDITKKNRVLQQVKNNRKELESKLSELEDINNKMIERELEMVKLKEDLNRIGIDSQK
ncbi:MAG: PAS domain-containing protein [Patescibacteria group bacterium]|jgi:PAS domain S-box-containing protein